MSRRARKRHPRRDPAAAAVTPGAGPRLAAPIGSANATPTAATAPSPYILSPRADLLFIVGAALLCPALILPAAQLTTPYTVWLVVMTFGAVGHHFPSFLRTYGDRSLFDRYRARLLLAPPLLFAVTLGFALKGLHGMLLVSMCWSIWHGMMQHFGFLRIYDAKVGAGSVVRARRLDFWISASWFGLCLAWSPNQGGSLLDALYASGVPLVPLQYIQGLRWLLIASTAVATVVYVTDAVRSKRPRSWLKLALLVGTFVYVAWVRVLTVNPYLSVALFELLHDMQYLAIVWAFNRRLVEKSTASGGVGPLTRWLYRPTAASVAGYVLACLAYGAIGLTVYTQVGDGTVKKVLEAFLLTSGLLHFYYDGFIWKLGQPDTKRGLDLSGPTPVRPASLLRPLLTNGYAHALLLGVPILLLASIEQRPSRVDDLARAKSMVQAVPTNPTSRNNYGYQLLQRGHTEEALENLRLAVALQPDLEEAKQNLQAALIERSQEMARAGDQDQAIALARQAVEINPRDADSHNNLGTHLANAGRLDQAEAEWRRTLELQPGHALALRNLQVLARQRTSG